MTKYRIYISIEEWVDGPDKFVRLTSEEFTLPDANIPCIGHFKGNKFEVFW